MGAMGGGDGDSDSLCGQNQKEKILVSVRLRPINDKERIKNDVSDWECVNRSTIIFKSTIPERSMFPSAYTFDRVFGSDCSTKQVYEEGAKEVALAAVNGINASVFAYGQTSSGKTYTMSGVTEYAVADIFDYIKKHPERQYVLKFSAMEIYNEAVRDLLSMDCTPLRLLDDPERGTVVERLTEETLMDWNHFLELLAVCDAQRHIGETSLNEVSSRSHQIVRLTIESSSKELHGLDTPSSLAACVNFVDLAGSERASQTMSAGARLKEGCHINRSLLTLGTVIRKLSKGRTGHVPYRDSKLTRILQNSLGGNARTAIICTMSPARSHVEQSRNTLLFASCAKEVTTNAQVNVVMSDKALVKQLQKELAKMERELRSIGPSSKSSDPSSLLREKELQIEKMSKEIKELHQQLEQAQSRIQDLQQPAGDNNGSVVSRAQNAASKKLERLTSNLEFAENPEDNFLLDGLSPRLSICTPNSKHIVAADPVHVWNNPSASKINEHSAEETCKEVRCIEEEEEEEEGEEEQNESLPEKSDEISDDATYNSLRSKIHEMQKTIDSLVSIYPESEASPSSSPDVIHKSRSSRSDIREIPPYVTPEATPEGSEQGSPRNSFHKRNASAPVLKAEAIKDSFRREVADETCTNIINYIVPEQKEVQDFQVKKQTHGKKEEHQIDHAGDEHNEDQEGSSEKVQESKTSSWEVEFKKSREKIIELWHVCNVPLAHRSYFFLLFKGDPSDSVYLEVEQRRLSFLTRSTSDGSQSRTSSSSLKALNKEREMLSKRIHSKYSTRARLELYQKWNIPLNSKQRSLQLARRLWTDTKDMAHIEASAELVGKLIGMFETKQVPKEMFGLSFANPEIRYGRRSFSWTPTISSLGLSS